YPDDQLVTPLVKLHLKYIEENRAQMLSRKTALVDFDPMEPAYVEEPVIVTRTPANPQQAVTPSAQIPVAADVPTAATEAITNNQTQPEEITNRVPQTAATQASPF